MIPSSYASFLSKYPCNIPPFQLLVTLCPSFLALCRYQAKNGNPSPTLLTGHGTSRPNRGTLKLNRARNCLQLKAWKMETVVVPNKGGDDSQVVQDAFLAHQNRKRQMGLASNELVRPHTAAVSSHYSRSNAGSADKNHTQTAKFLKQSSQPAGELGRSRPVNAGKPPRPTTSCASQSHSSSNLRRFSDSSKKVRVDADPFKSRSQVHIDWLVFVSGFICVLSGTVCVRC